MKKSEIKDLYNHSDAALRQLKYMTLILPYSSDQVIAENTKKAAAQAAELWKPVKVMCDYMIDDGSTDMTERLLNIKAEVVNIQNSVLKMTIADSKEAFELIQNCQAIKNTVKDMEEWTANGVEPQHKPIAASQQPSEGNGGELAGSSNETQPEGKGQTVIKKEDLPTIYDDENKVREQQVFYNAIQNNLMVLNADGKGYTWKTNGKLLALMCAILYWNDEIKKNTVSNDPLNTTFFYTLEKNNVYFEDAARLKEMFGGKNISNYRSKLKELPEDWEIIDKLF